uniref:Uncharacterized protein n=1 Tax=uncultured bacterium contig00018 TaxID=1181509 RepID=A0A806KFI7_9BACT|nr:hypothetical protein [uncultured bacterium contig00018]
MKGVIVQTGEPKSIVLLNNGKITAIPTPANGHVGMVVTVKYSSLLRIILISLAVIILLALGILIGAYFFGDTEETSPYEYWPGRHRHGHMMEQRQ